MKGEAIFESIADIDEKYIAEAREETIQKKYLTWIKRIVIAACICLAVTGSINILQRFDYSIGGRCSAESGTIVDGVYYYQVDHSGVWRYSDGVAEKVLNTFWENGGWHVNSSGLYYCYGKTVYRMDLETLKRKKLFSVKDGTHIGFSLTRDGNVIITVYDKKEHFKYQVLINGENGDLIEQLTDRISYDSNLPMYTGVYYQVGERRIELIRNGGDAKNSRYMPTENGEALLPAGYWVSDFGRSIDGVLCFEIHEDNVEATWAKEMLVLFADGKTVIVPAHQVYHGVIGHTLLYSRQDSQENYGSNGVGIWCYDSDTGETWQLAIDSESEFYDFTNDNEMLYSCVPWGDEQTAWKIVYEGNKPVSLQLVDKNIIE